VHYFSPNVLMMMECLEDEHKDRCT